MNLNFQQVRHFMYSSFMSYITHVQPNDDWLKKVRNMSHYWTLKNTVVLTTSYVTITVKSFLLVLLVQHTFHSISSNMTSHTAPVKNTGAPPSATGGESNELPALPIFTTLGNHSDNHWIHGLKHSEPSFRPRCHNYDVYKHDTLKLVCNSNYFHPKN